MNEPNFGIDGVRTELELERWAADAAAKAQRYQDMQRQVSAVTSTESSRDGSVTVTVDSAGAVTDLRIARTIPGPQAAALVLDTMRRAQSRISGRVAEVVQSTVGGDAETAQAVVSAYRQRFPEPEPLGRSVGRELRLGYPEPGDPAANRPVRRPRAPRRDEDDDWNDGTILR